jgi:hypothetical protein
MSKRVGFRGFTYHNDGTFARMSAQMRPVASMDAIMMAHSAGMTQSAPEKAIAQTLSGNLTQIPFVLQYIEPARQQLQQKYDTDMVQIRQLPEPYKQQQQSALEAYLTQHMDAKIEEAGAAYVAPLVEQNKQLRQQQYDAEVGAFQQVFLAERARLAQTHPPNQVNARTRDAYLLLNTKFQDGIRHFNEIYQDYEINMYILPQVGSSHRKTRSKTRRNKKTRRVRH